MKGLLIKDLLIMRNQISSILLILGMGALMSVYMEATTLIAYLMMLGAMLALSTLAYDEHENGYRYLFTLPTTRKEYVTEKYLFCLIWVICAMAVGSVGCYLIMMFKNRLNPEDLISTVVVMFSTISLLSAVTIPTRLKYGSEKSKIIIYALFGSVTGIGLILSRLVSKETAARLETFVSTNGPVLALTLMTAVILLMIISYLISVRIMEKKEF